MCPNGAGGSRQSVVESGSTHPGRRSRSTAAERWLPTKSYRLPWGGQCSSSGTVSCQGVSHCMLKLWNHLGTGDLAIKLTAC